MEKAKTKGSKGVLWKILEVREFTIIVILLLI